MWSGTRGEEEGSRLGDSVGIRKSEVEYREENKQGEMSEEAAILYFIFYSSLLDPAYLQKKL